MRNISSVYFNTQLYWLFASFYIFKLMNYTTIEIIRGLQCLLVTLDNRLKYRICFLFSNCLATAKFILELINLIKTPSSTLPPQTPLRVPRYFEARSYIPVFLPNSSQSPAPSHGSSCLPSSFSPYPLDKIFQKSVSGLLF